MDIEHSHRGWTKRMSMASIAVTTTAILATGCGPAVAPASAPASTVASQTTTAPRPRVTVARKPQPTATASSNPTRPVAAACTTARALATWSNSQLAWQVLVVPAQLGDVAGVGPEVRQGVGGVIYFGGIGPADLASQIAALGKDRIHGIPAFESTDAEGGLVLRDSNALGPVPSARYMGAAYTANQVRVQAETLGARMRKAGLNMDFAPVADEDGGPGPDATHPDGTRSFSANPRVVTNDVVAFVKGLHDAGAVAVVKHYPGLGGSHGNSDTAPSQTLPWQTLKASGALDPFNAAIAAGAPAVMMSNYTVPGLTTGPATVSLAAYRVLRQEDGFQGLVVTDSLTAGALYQAGFTVISASVAAIADGADMALFGYAGGPNSDVALAAQANANAHAIVNAISTAVANGTISRARLINAAGHVLAAKHVDLCRGL